MGAEEGAEGGLEEGAGEGLVSTLEAAMYVVCSQTYHTWSLYHSGVDAIESMMRSQLAAAVGKVLKASDFSEYMAYHQRLLFRDEYDEEHLYCIIIVLVSVWRNSHVYTTEK